MKIRRKRRIEKHVGEVATFTEYRVTCTIEYVDDRPKVKRFNKVARFSTMKAAHEQFELVLDELRAMFPNATLNVEYGEDGRARILEYYSFRDMPYSESKGVYLSRIDLDVYERTESIDEAVNNYFLDSFDYEYEDEY